LQVVDSIFPPAVELARFQRTITGPKPIRLDGPSSRSALVRAFIGAVETRDSATIRRLLISRAEFGYLYFPSSEYTKPPYVQKPGLVWFRMTATSEKGIGRVLARDGGSPLGLTGHRCPVPPLVQGKNRIWKDCLVLVRRAGKPVERRLFGSIIERGGRFKFLTYASEY
jgi:hypothetical protein